MKTLIVAACIVLFVNSAFGSPLIFKTEKAISSPDKYAEFFTLDTSKFHKIRIHVSTVALRFNVLITAIEGDQEFHLLHKTIEAGADDNIILDVPPSRIRVQVWGQGTFKAAVWGQ